MLKNNIKNINPCIIGLGYVGLPLLLKLSKKFKTFGYDISKKRILDLKKGNDIFNEVSKKNLKKNKIFLTSNIKKINKCNLFIVTVPTPIKKDKRPDLSHIEDVCDKLSKIVKLGDIIVFESTVYPGLTENLCIPKIEKNSLLKNGQDFFVGYSPERVNPGDKKHTLQNINKILAYPHLFKKTELIKLYSNLGKKIIFTKNIKEAETAKVIENIQRDVNIGLINEIYLACEALKVNYKSVFRLASTKWNFLKFQPGLVGGHCLPVDPYYFTDICKKNNFLTKITLAGRDINDSMSYNVQKKIEKLLNNKITNKNFKILICGLSYKKNVADLRNSLPLDIFNKLKNKYKNIQGYDPIINPNESKRYNMIKPSNDISNFDIYIILTPHSILMKKIEKLKNKQIVSFFD